MASGVGDAVTGAAMAHAVEQTPASAHAAGGATCLNCGTTLIGPHCHVCGQSGHVHQSLAAIGHDLMHGVLHLDGKLWRTLPMLAIRPGQLSRRYIDGQRARFVSPMAMFLFSVFLMFAVFQMVGLTAPTDVATPASYSETMEQLQATAAAERDTAVARLGSMKSTDPGYAAAKDRVDQLQRDMAALAGLQPSAAGIDGGKTIGKSDIPWLDKAITKWRHNPSLMIYKLQSNGYKFSWLLIVLSIPFVWLLFAWKRRFHAYDHAVFVTYSLAFMSLLFIALSLVSLVGIGGDWIFLALAVIPPIHIYKQLRGTYGLSRLSALWRLAMLSAFIVIVLLLFLQALMFIGSL